MAQYQQQGQPEFNAKKALPVVIFVGIGLFLLIFWSSITVTIDSGQKGVLFHYFTGLERDKVYGEGMHFIAPWNKMIIYDVRLQELKEKMTSLSSNGLNITVDIAARYNPYADQIGNLHGEVKDYEQTAVINVLRSVARNVIGRYTPEEIYSTKRESIQTEIFEESKPIMAEKYVDLNMVFIRSIELPPTIKTAIENKLKQEQLAKEYDFKLVKAQKEAQRQKIEAEGKATANRIISASLTDKILKEKGILATLELANSPNSKVVVVGSGKDGLPMILGGNN